MMNKPCNLAYVYNFAVNIEVLMQLWYMMYNLHQSFYNLQTRYIEKKVSLWFLGVQHSVILADFIMPEAQQPIIVILSTYSS